MLKNITFTGWVRLALLFGLPACVCLVVGGSEVPADILPLPIILLSAFGVYRAPIDTSRVMLVIVGVMTGHSLFYSHMDMKNPHINNPFDSMFSMWISYTPLLLILLCFLILAFSKEGEQT